MSVPSELKVVTRQLLEQLLVCRPADSISFSVQYYADERSGKTLVNHALHSLMFLLRRPTEFRDAMGTIYCSEVLCQKDNPPPQTKTQKDNITNKQSKEKDNNSSLGIVQSQSESEILSEDSSSSSSILQAIDGENGKDRSDTPNASENSTMVEDIKDTISSTLFEIGRSAVRAAARGSKNVIDESDSQNWMYTVIENSLGNTLVSGTIGDTLDFETFIAFIRMYLCLRIVTGCVNEILLKKYLNSSVNYLSGGGNEVSMHLEMAITTDLIVVPEDTVLLEQILNSVLTKQSQPQDNKKVVGAVVQQYLSLLMRDSNGGKKTSK